MKCLIKATATVLIMSAWGAVLKRTIFKPFYNVTIINAVFLSLRSYTKLASLYLVLHYIFFIFIKSKSKVWILLLLHN